MEFVKRKWKFFRDSFFEKKIELSIKKMCFIEHLENDSFRVAIAERESINFHGVMNFEKTCNVILKNLSKDCCVAFVMAANKSIARFTQNSTSSRLLYENMKFPENFIVHHEKNLGIVIGMNKKYTAAICQKFKEHGIVIQVLMTKQLAAVVDSQDLTRDFYSRSDGIYTIRINRAEKSIELHNGCDHNADSINVKDVELYDKAYALYAKKLIGLSRISIAMHSENLMSSLIGLRDYYDLVSNTIYSGFIASVKICIPCIFAYTFFSMPFYIYRERNIVSKIYSNMNMSHCGKDLECDYRDFEKTYKLKQLYVRNHKKCAAESLIKIIRDADKTIAKTTKKFQNFIVENVDVKLQKYPRENNVNVKEEYRFTFDAVGVKTDHINQILDFLNKRKEIAGPCKFINKKNNTVVFSGILKVN